MGVALSMNIDEARGKVREFKLEAESAKTSVTELNRLVRIYVALARRGGLPPELMDLIAKAQQTSVAIETLTRSIITFYTVGGPLGWLLGLGGLALSGLMVADIMEIGAPQY